MYFLEIPDKTIVVGGQCDISANWRINIFGDNVRKTLPCLTALPFDLLCDTFPMATITPDEVVLAPRVGKRKCTS